MYNFFDKKEIKSKYNVFSGYWLESTTINLFNRQIQRYSKDLD